MTHRLKKRHILFLLFPILIATSILLGMGERSRRVADFFYTRYDGKMVLERHLISREKERSEELVNYVEEYFLGPYIHENLDPLIKIQDIQGIIIYGDSVLINLYASVLESNIEFFQYQRIEDLLQQGIRRSYNDLFDIRFLLEGNEFLSANSLNG